MCRERRRPRAGRRAGASLAELLVALALIGVVAAAVASLLRTEGRLSAHTADRAEALDAIRTAAAVLSTDLAPLDTADLHAVHADSIALRVFRGTGIVCGFAAADPLVRYRGLRQPEPDKDSVLVASAEPERVDSLRDAQHAPGACVAGFGEEIFRIRLGTPVVAHDVLLFFETGGYHLDGALRYRRGGGGRQPLTADVFASTSRFELSSGTAGAAPTIATDLGPAASRGALRGLPVAPALRLRVPLRNGARP